MKQEHMNKARAIFQKGAEQMVAAGIDPADVSAALVGVGASISVNVDGVEATGAWLTEIAESLKSCAMSVRPQFSYLLRNAVMA